MRAERVRGAIVLPVLAASLVLAPLPAWIVENLYARDIYPWLQMGLTSVSNTVPFAWLDAFIVLAALLVGHRLVRLWGTARGLGVMSALWQGVRRLIRAAAVVTLAFLVLWGLNYRRRSLEDSLGHAAPPTLSADLLRESFTQANALGGRLRPIVRGSPELSFEDVAAGLHTPMNDALHSLRREPLGVAGRPKHSRILRGFFVRAGVDGMLNPLALESILNHELLAFERPFVLAHEWAHLAGHADEAEASAVGWFACMHGPPAFAYSASIYLINSLQGVMPGEVRRAALARLDPGVREDLVALAERLRREDPAVQQAAFRVYDGYLKANRVEGGTQSYGRALHLILSPQFRSWLVSYR